MCETEYVIVVAANEHPMEAMAARLAP